MLCPNVDSNYIVRYIELNNNKILFNNISMNTNFEEIKRVLGETDIVEIEMDCQV